MGPQEKTQNVGQNVSVPIPPTLPAPQQPPAQRRASAHDSDDEDETGNKCVVGGVFGAAAGMLSLAAVHYCTGMLPSLEKAYMKDDEAQLRNDLTLKDEQLISYQEKLKDLQDSHALAPGPPYLPTSRWQPCLN